MELCLLPLVALATMLQLSSEYRLLVVYPVPSRSHGILGDGIVAPLLQAGHEVTYITPFPKKDRPKQLTQIDISFLVPEMTSLTKMFTEKQSIPFSTAKKIVYSLSTLMLKSEVVQQLLQDTTRRFDAVITEWSIVDLNAGFAQVFQCPWILSSQIGMMSQLEFIIDEVQSPAISPNLITGYSVPMTLYERIINSAITFGGVLNKIFIDRPYHEPAYRRYFGPAAEARGVVLQEYTAACHNVSFLLVNSHPSYGQAARMPPNAVEIGGYHIDPNTKPLPKDLQELLDRSHEGLIYFSMGSNLKSADMTSEMRKELLEAFASLKQTVLWKFETKLEGLPQNVHIRDWVPQQSLLAHKNVKVFITHGGLLSTIEAVHFGMPLIGIPVYGDQPMNMRPAERMGYALKVDLHSPHLGKELGEAILKMLSQTSYSQTAKRLSQLFHDRPTPPARLVSYWTEHVVRTGGAPHLRTAASVVPAYQRYLLDILALIVAALLIIFLLLRALVRAIFRRISKVVTSKQDKKKRN